ncbi:hypothetical protein PQQ49_35035, partial [Paraburkholderia strydomiana]
PMSPNVFLTELMMTTPRERTKAVTDTRELLQILARADDISIGGLVQMRRPLHCLESGPHRNTGGLAQQQARNVKGTPWGDAMLAILGIKEKTMTTRHVVPDDFPGELAPGLLPGAQPKLLVRETGGRYHTVLQTKSCGHVMKRARTCPVSSRSPRRERMTTRQARHPELR